MFWRNEQDLAQVFSKLNWGSAVAVLAALHSIIRLQPHRAYFEKALKSQISFIYLLISVQFIFQAVLQL